MFDDIQDYCYFFINCDDSVSRISESLTIGLTGIFWVK